MRSSETVCAYITLSCLLSSITSGIQREESDSFVHHRIIHRRSAYKTKREDWLMRNTIPQADTAFSATQTSNKIAAAIQYHDPERLRQVLRPHTKRYYVDLDIIHVFELRRLGWETIRTQESASTFDSFRIVQLTSRGKRRVKRSYEVLRAHVDH